MQFTLLTLFLSLLTFLFCLYGLSKDDSLLLRKNISLDHIFNLALVEVSAGLFFARLFYVLFNFDPFFLNLLTFLLFPYFPGLSLTGAVLGGSISVYLIGKLSKTPTWHLFDFFSLSFLAAITTGIFMNVISNLVLRKTSFIEIIIFLIYVFALALFLKLLQKGEVGDGSTGFLFLIFFSLTSLLQGILTNIIYKTNGFWLFLDKEDFLLIVIFLVSSIVFIKKENLLLKFKK